MKKVTLALIVLSLILGGSYSLFAAPSTEIPKERKHEIIRQEWERALEAVKEEQVVEKKEVSPKKEIIIPQKFRKSITLYAQGVTLQSALSEIVRMTDTNLTIQKEVNIAQPISVEIDDTPAFTVLQTILSPLGYSFKMTQDGLYVYEIDTQIFRLALPPITHRYSSNISNEPMTITEVAGRAGAKIGVSALIDKADFWDDLKKDIPTLLTTNGKYTVNPQAGLVTVTDTVPALERVEKYIDQLNQEVSRQIFVKVKVVEVTLDKEHTLGIDWEVVKQSLGISTGLAPASIPGGASVFSIRDVLEVDKTTGAINKKYGMEMIITAIEEMGEIRIISQPQLLVLNNQPAMLQVGDATTFVAQITTDTSEFETTHTVETADVYEGVSLALCARIMNDEDVFIALTPVVGKVKEIRTINFADILIEAPKVTSRSMSSNLKVRSGETIIMGGLISEDMTKTERRIPWLGRIPVLKYLFSSRTEKKQKTELVFLITPEIIK